MSWFTKNLTSFFSKLISSLWNDSVTKWNDSSATWNSITPGAWYEKNNSEWYD